jgi:hypothetical protein
MVYISVVNPLVYSLQSSSYSPPCFWGFDVSPPCISIVKRSGRRPFVKEKVAELPKNKQWVGSVFLLAKAVARDLNKCSAEVLTCWSNARRLLSRPQKCTQENC